MNNNPWKIEHINEPMVSVIDGKMCTSDDYYKVTFKGLVYAAIGGEFLACKTPDQLMQLLFQMLNDAHDLALKHKEETKND